MWRAALVAVLLPSLLVAEGQDSAMGLQSQHFIEADLPKPTYQAFTEWQTIRQGTTEKGAVLLAVGNERIVSPRNSSASVVPLKLDFDPAEGLSLISIAIPKGKEMRVSFQKRPIAMLGAGFGVEFKVKASKNAPLGQHMIHGRLSYQPIRGNGVFAPQQMDIAIPVTVVEHDAIISRSPEYSQMFGRESDANRDRLILILLSPILLPLTILAALVGMDC